MGVGDALARLAGSGGVGLAAPAGASGARRPSVPWLCPLGRRQAVLGLSGGRSPLGAPCPHGFGVGRLWGAVCCGKGMLTSCPPASMAGAPCGGGGGLCPGFLPAGLSLTIPNSLSLQLLAWEGRASWEPRPERGGTGLGSQREAMAGLGTGARCPRSQPGGLVSGCPCPLWPPCMLCGVLGSGGGRSLSLPGAGCAVPGLPARRGPHRLEWD